MGCGKGGIGMFYGVLRGVWHSGPNHYVYVYSVPRSVPPINDWRINNEVCS